MLRALALDNSHDAGNIGSLVQNFSDDSLDRLGANMGTSPTWVFVNAQPSKPLVNLLRQNFIPWHQLNVPW